MPKTVKYAEYDIELMDLQRAARRLSDGTIEIYERQRFREPVCLGINWSAVGTVAPEKAAEFAGQIMQVVELVKNFKYNGYTIER